jgi:hypothetical protein
MELVRKPPEGVLIPSAATVSRIWFGTAWWCSGGGSGSGSPTNAGNVRAMQLWQLDIVGGMWLVDVATGVLRGAKVVTGVDDRAG